MPTNETLRHPAIAQLLAMNPVYEKIFTDNIRKIEKSFFDGEAPLLNGETLLSSWMWYNQQEKSQEITVVTLTSDNDFRVHTMVIFKNDDQPFYGSNLYHDAMTMISRLARNARENQRWCGAQELSLYKQYAEAMEA
jgi:hypothetical protein